MGYFKKVRTIAEDYYKSLITPEDFEYTAAVHNIDVEDLVEEVNRIKEEALGELTRLGQEMGEYDV